MANRYATAIVNGENTVLSAGDRMLDGDSDVFVTETKTSTLTNKTINADNNTVTDLEVDNLKTGVLDTDLASVSAEHDTLASAKSIKFALNSLEDELNNSINALTGTGMFLSDAPSWNPSGGVFPGENTATDVAHELGAAETGNVSTTVTGAHTTADAQITVASTTGMAQGAPVKFAGHATVYEVATVDDATHVTLTQNLTASVADAEAMAVGTKVVSVTAITNIDADDYVLIDAIRYKVVSAAGNEITVDTFFPHSGATDDAAVSCFTVRKGETFYAVTTVGTIDGYAFQIQDAITAKKDNPSVSLKADWLIFDNTENPDILRDGDVIDDDTMATASSTTIATSESIVAYIGTEISDALAENRGRITLSDVIYVDGINALTNQVVLNIAVTIPSSLMQVTATTATAFSGSEVCAIVTQKNGVDVAGSTVTLNSTNTVKATFAAASFAAATAYALNDTVSVKVTTTAVAAFRRIDLAFLFEVPAV